MTSWIIGEVAAQGIRVGARGVLVASVGRVMYGSFEVADAGPLLQVRPVTIR